MVQYRTALDCGFIIPDTVYANSKKSVETFAEKHDTLCLKSIEGTDVWDDEHGVDYVFYTQILQSKDVHSIPEEAFIQTVNFVQEYVPKAYELRVTVVGNDLFAAKILSQELPDDKGKIDWRQGYESGLSFIKCELPTEIKDKCINVVHALGLNFGCIDLIVRPDGNYVFLECNPNGQWLWIELMTGMKISESIARFLYVQK
jgi:glutathione synthase/RimK-type ligase-like ATP-grasp enzyme